MQGLRPALQPNPVPSLRDAEAAVYALSSGAMGLGTAHPYPGLLHGREVPGRSRGTEAPFGGEERDFKSERGRGALIQAAEELLKGRGKEGRRSERYLAPLGDTWRILSDHHDH